MNKKLLLSLALALLGAACSKTEAPPSAKEGQKEPSPATPGARRIELTVTDKGFEPSPVKVKAGEPLELVVTRKTDKTCATEIVVKDYGIDKKLPLNEPVVVALTPKQPGEIKYGCGMDQMVSGVLVVE